MSKEERISRSLSHAPRWPGSQSLEAGGLAFRDGAQKSSNKVLASIGISFFSTVFLVQVLGQGTSPVRQLTVQVLSFIQAVPDMERKCT